MDDIRMKYSKLLRAADKRCVALHQQQKEAKKKAMENRGDLRAAEDYQEAKRDYLIEKRVAQIYGIVTADLGDK
jgi:hypothetical protein